MLGIDTIFSGAKARIAQRDASFLVPLLLFCLAIAAGVVLIDQDRRSQFDASERLEAAKQLLGLSARLEADVNANVNLVQGLVTVMSVHPVNTQDEFEALASSLFARPSQLKVLAAAPDMVVRMVYPLAPNRKALGLDYRTSAEQWPGVMRARDSRSLVINGPIHLVQGGTGLIGRYPVFLRDGGAFWGIVSAIIDLDKLYADAGLNSRNALLNVALYRQPDIGKRQVFFGDARVLDQEPVQLTLPIGVDTWHLAAVPARGWGQYGTELGRFRAYMILISIAILLPLLWAGLLTKQRQANMRELRRREEQLETLSQRLGLALKASSVGVWEYIPETDRLIWDHKMRELYGVRPTKEICDYTDWTAALHPDDLEQAQADFKRCIEREIPYITEFRIIDSHGEIRYIRAHGAIYRNSAGRLRVVGANWDITRDITLQSALREASEQLEHQSLHDALTGLPNRRYLERLLDNEAEQVGGRKLALIHADLDHFKEVNDTFGHRTGDGVLKAAAERLRSLVRFDEVASRIGGDEFVILTTGEEAEARARQLADGIVAALAEPILFEQSLCRIGCSAGIAVQSFRHENPLQLLGNADIALYEAKKKGRNRVEFFSDGLRLAVVEAKRTTDELILALERDEFIPYFQPQFDAVTLDIVGAEALARWNHETRGILTPDRFLAIAEAANKVAEIDESIFEKALFHLARWQAKGLNIPAVSVNISAQRLGDEALFEALARKSIVPGTVSFELLETISLDGSDQALLAAARRLKAAGIDIEIDDFGSGHASIISLLELAPKRLKIDRQLVAPITESRSRRQLVASIIEIGRSQGIEIVAEGVETMEHATILRDLGCHALQGYAFARPMPAAAMITFATDWQTRKTSFLAAS